MNFGIIKIRKTGFILVLVAALSFSMTACAPEDTDIKVRVDEKLSGTPDVTVVVENGVVTLSGEFKDDTARKETEAEVKTVVGVKAVVNHTTVTATQE